MPDSNPKLTASLRNTRDVLVNERSEIIRQVDELKSLLEANASQIEAADTLMLRFNPDHISLDVRTDLEAAPMLVVGRTLQLSSSTSREVLSTPPVAPSSEHQPSEATKTGRISKSARGKGPATAKSKRKIGSKTDDATSEEMEGNKAKQRSPAQQAIADYFRKSNRNDTILKILEGKTEPVNAATIAQDYEALHPLPSDTPEMRSLHNSRVSSGLYYLKDRGQAVRIADDRGEGKTGINVRWEISKSYRSDLRKGRKNTKAKNPKPHAAKPGAEAETSATAH